MKVSLICPIYNEKDSVANLIDSILSQSKKPDEIIFVDSFSRDGTTEIIKKYSRQGVRLIQEKSNIAEARNIAIKNAKYDIIAATDASSILDKNWLKNIIAPFKDREIDVVSGGYIAISEGGIEDYISKITVRPMRQWDEKTFLPSGRSIAFKKTAWRTVGGYPEKYLTGEDTLFALKLKQAGFKFKLNKKAIVYWRGRSTIRKFAKQFYLYGKGDKKFGNLMMMKKNLLLIVGFWVYLFLIAVFAFWQPLVSFVLILLPLIYLLLVGIRSLIKIKRMGAIFWMPLLLVIKRVSYILGGTFG
jgi:glycosyltransferase involved in cell wall biosynthesis